MGTNIWFLLTVLWLISYVCNLVHYWITRVGVLNYRPYLGFTTLIWLPLCGLLAVLYFMGILSAIYLYAGAFGYLVFLDVYSIFRRHRTLRAKGRKPERSLRPIHLNIRAVVIYSSMVVIAGALWGFVAVEGSTPHAPAWTRHTMPIIGGVSGVAFVAAYFWVKKK